jgi:rhomboid protease GluP
MIFLRYESFRGYLRLYPITSLVLALNLISFILDYVVGGARPLLNYGAFILEPADPYGLLEPWRYVSSVFLHSNLTHLLYNSFSLLIFAPPLERLLGHFRYALFYLLCGVLGNAANVIIRLGTDIQDIQHVSIGASGAVYGIFGAYLFMALFRKHSMDEGSRKTVYSVLIFGLIYSVLSPRIDIWAHIGGGVAGFLLYDLFNRSKRAGTGAKQWN